MSESLHVIALAQAADVGDTDLPETPVLYTGTFQHGGRTIPVSEADLDRAVENFNAQLAAGTEIPVDYEHGKAEGGIASGWYKALRREGNRLLAKIAWTDKAREQVKSGARKYFSPEFALTSKSETGEATGFKLLAGALVVRPHLKGLGAVAMTDDASRELAREFVALDATALSQVTQPITGSAGANTNYTITLTGDTAKLFTSAGTSVHLTPKDARDMSDTPVTAKEVETLTATLAEVQATVETLKADNVKLSERADAAETAAADSAKQLDAERLNAALSQARREGRLDAKDETTAKWQERAEKFGLDEVKALLAELPAETIPVTERGHGTDKPIEASDAPEGVDPDSYKAAQLAEKYESEGLSADEAASKAYKEVYV